MSVYFHLGSAYAKIKAKQKALKALKKCIELCEKEARDPEKPPYRNARELISELES